MRTTRRPRDRRSHLVRAANLIDGCREALNVRRQGFWHQRRLTFSQDLHDLAVWFKSHGVTNIAMESIGVDWIPAFEILEQHGFEVILVHARYAKNVPGRKTDVSDASWLRQSHSYGLLRGSFRPTAQIAKLRAYLRQRERLVEYAAAHIQHMQKALLEMILQLHHVVSDIAGVTGKRKHTNNGMLSPPLGDCMQSPSGNG